MALNLNPTSTQAIISSVITESLLQTQESLLLKSQPSQLEQILKETADLSKFTKNNDPGELLSTIQHVKSFLEYNSSITPSLITSQSEKIYISTYLSDIFTQLIPHFRSHSIATSNINSLLEEFIMKKYFVNDDIINILETLVSLINSSNVTSIFSVAQTVLSLWNKATEIPASKAPLLSKLSNVCFEELHSCKPKTRMSALRLFWKIALFSSTQSAYQDLEQILTEFCQDSDSRVRKTAVEGLLRMVEMIEGKEQSRLLELYNHSKILLIDDYEEVRVLAVKLVHKFAKIYPETVLGTRAKQQKPLTLLDDAFMRLCYASNDSCVSVKLAALESLGSFSRASEDILLHSLEKTFSHVISVVTETLSMHGFVSAFVQGLDDEFAEVRLTALQAVSEIAKNNTRFASSALELIVDMFGDEIQSVRLQAIRSLSSFSTNVSLKEEQLDVVLYILEDSSQFIREAIHRLLGACSLATGEAIDSTVCALLTNLTKYPLDVYSIWTSMKGIGSNNGQSVCSQVSSLLRTHPFYISSEPDTEDPAYVSILILVFNALSTCSTIIPLLPTHVCKHYPYLKDAHPNLVPQIRIGAYNSSIVDSVTPSDLTSSFIQQFEYVLLNIQSPSIKVLKTHAFDFFSLAQRGSTLLPVSAYASFVFYSFSLLLELSNLISQSHFSPGLLKSKAIQAIKYIARLKYQFHGLSENEIKLFSQWENSAWDFANRSLVNRSDISDQSVALLSVDKPDTCPSAKLQIVTARIYDPRPNDAENCIKFAPGLAFSIHINVVISNCLNTNNLAITICMPDDKVVLHKPKMEEFSQLSDTEYRLLTSIVLDGKKWSNVGKIEIRVVIVYDREEETTSHELIKFDSEVHTTSKLDDFVRNDSLRHNTIILSTPTTLHIKSK